MQTQTWFITGAASGFGAAFAEYALAQGWNVVATARDPAKLAHLVEKAPARVLAVGLDVTDGTAARRAVDAAVARFGGIDTVINNAGYAIVGAVEETPDAELRAQMETNFFGAASVIRAVLPLLRRQKSGAIVNISSMGGQMSFAGFGAYSASKFALEGLSEALAQELAPLGIKVLIVEPGAFRTNLAGAAMRYMPSIADYQSTAGGTRDFARGMHAAQAGDPHKAAHAVDLALRADKTPLRLVLGNDAVESLRGHAEQFLAELAGWEAVGRNTDFAKKTNCEGRP